MIGKLIPAGETFVRPSFEEKVEFVDEFIDEEEEILPEIEEEDGIEVINFTDLFEDDDTNE